MNDTTTPGAATGPYEAREFDLSAVTGLSARAVELHLELYKGYVKACNELIAEQTSAYPEPGAAATPLDLASHARRFAFEYNGMVLHELFFEALGAPGLSSPESQPALADAAGRTFGGVAQWAKHAAGLAALRGVGWVVTVLQPTTRRLYNTWVDLHHLSVPADARIVLALDLWEHAYLLDFAPAQRANYFEMLWTSVDWPAVDKRCA
jgi:Fe-Mn family superoxide dismutase